ncbi:MAG: cell division protein FtsA [Solobacterium sp.]|nr:cell division protein FtsA [Solobacterium sp.]
MNEKQIYAALEASDHEVRLVIGEFFNTRFNILKVERIPTNAVTYNGVVDPEGLVAAVKTAVANTSKMISADIKKVLIAMPSYRMKRYPFTSTVLIDGIEEKVGFSDVNKALRIAEQMDIGRDYALIQTVPIRYTVNGIASRRVPVDEKASQMTVEIDVLCADRKFSYDLVACIEKAGLSVKDIFLDVYAAGKEAAIFEQAVNHQVIVLKMERESTTLGLMRKGRLTTATVVPFGIGNIARALTDKYGLDIEAAVELVKYSINLNEPVFTNNPVHIWAENDVTRTITEAQLAECIRENVEIWVSGIEKTCIPILQAGATAVMITGEGGETAGLSDLLQARLGVETRVYIPETLGGRNAGLSACLGLFYAYQDKLPLHGETDDSLDMEAFIRAVSYREKKPEGTKEDTLTNKLRGLFLEGKNKVDR